MGPDLTATARLLDRRRLIESILQPSKEIAPQFVPWTIETAAGQILVGLLVAEGLAGEQTYADAKGNTFTLTPAEIVRREPQAASIMPDGLAAQLTVAEIRDLLAFLQSPR